VIRVRDARCPCVIWKAVTNRRIPPAILNAGIVKLNTAKIHCPKNAKTPRVTVATTQLFAITRRFCSSENPSVRVRKGAITPGGSTIAIRLKTAATPNAKSTMRSRWRRSERASIKPVGSQVPCVSPPKGETRYTLPR